MAILPIIFVCIVGYLLGSIPFGLLLTKLAGHGDIRTIGSGNIGATNVLRTGDKKLAALVLFLDGLKGAIAVGIAECVYPGLGVYAAVAALLGHMFPVWLKFKGGKGVATSIGVLLALSWPVGLGVILTWLLMAKIFRYSSLSALIGIGLSPVFAIACGSGSVTALAFVIVALVFYTHRENIKRLIAGTEPKIGEKK